jgi:hypothetical protein
MRCSAIAQRIALQEYLLEKEQLISAEIEGWVTDDDKIKTLDRATVEAMLETWLEDF